MTAISAFIKRHLVPAYFALTFAISWGGILVLGSPYGMPTTSGQFAARWPVVFIPYFLGPSLASVILTGLVHGRTGFRDLLSRLLRWRLSVRWYAVALLTAPLLVTPTLCALSLVSPVFVPAILTSDNKGGLLLTAAVTGIVLGGFLEELGWTGVAVPELRRRFSVLVTGLIVGILWGAWHFLPTFWGSGNSSGELDLLLLLPPCLFYVGILPAFRVLMVWVYDRTGSWLALLIMHASLTASTLFVLAPAARGTLLLTYYIILTVLVWFVVAAIARTGRRQLSRNQEARTPQKGLTSG